MRLLVPGYVYPSEGRHFWDRILLVAPILDSVIVNVDSGVGRRYDPVWADLVAALHRRGIGCLGYVWVGYGARTWPEIHAEARAWRESYGVEGLFLDGVPPQLGPSEAPHLIRLRQEGAARLVANPGVLMSGSAVTHLDMVVDWEGTTPPRSLPAMPDGPRRAWVGHGVGAWRRALRRALRSSVEALWLTDRSGANPYDALPSYWASLTELLLERQSARTPIVDSACATPAIDRDRSGAGPRSAFLGTSGTRLSPGA